MQRAPTCTSHHKHKVLFTTTPFISTEKHAFAASYSAPRFHWVKCFGNHLVTVQTASAFFKCRSRLWRACEITSVISSLQTGICCFQYSATSNNTQTTPGGERVCHPAFWDTLKAVHCVKGHTHVFTFRCACCVSARMCVCNSHACRGQRTTSASILRSCPLRQGISRGFSLSIRLDCLANKPLSLLPALRWPACTTMSGFLCQFWELNSDPQAVQSRLPL